MTINCGTGLLWGHREQGAACALCRHVLCALILIQELFFYHELTKIILKTFQYDGYWQITLYERNIKLCVMKLKIQRTNYRKFLTTWQRINKANTAHILSFAVHLLGFTCLGKVFRKNARNDRRIRWNKVQVGSKFPLEFPFNYTSCVFHFSPTCLADSWSYRHDLNNLPPAHLSWMSKLSLKLMNVSSGSRTT